MLWSNSMVPGGRPLIFIGYKYNKWKVLYFSVTDNTVITQSGLPYLYKYPVKVANVYIRPFSSPHVVSKFFGSVNEVDSHKK